MVVPYSGSTWCASTSILEQLVEQGDNWNQEVTIDASCDLESFAKSIAILEIGGLKRLMDEESHRIDKLLPSKVKKFWEAVWEDKSMADIKT